MTKLSNHADDASPLVGVVIPVYNGERYVAEAIRSAFAQTHRPIEVLVVDDGSTDRSAAVVADFPQVRYVRQNQAGPGAARNTGVRAARGELIAFLDADDLWIGRKLALQVEALEQDPTLDAVFGLVEQFVSPELDEQTRNALRCPPEPMPGYVPGAMLVRREAFLRVGWFDESVKFGEFIDWHGRASEVGLKMKLLDTVLLKRRLHKTNLGIRERFDRSDYAKVLKAALDRRRKSGLLFPEPFEKCE